MQLRSIWSGNSDATDTLALLPGSPAINAAGSAGCPATDQRGVPRPPGHCDIGAFQLVEPVPGAYIHARRDHQPLEAQPVPPSWLAQGENR